MTFLGPIMNMSQSLLILHESIYESCHEHESICYVLPAETIAQPIFLVFFTLFFNHCFLIFPIHSHFLAMSVSTTITAILPTKFGQVTTGTLVVN